MAKFQVEPARAQGTAQAVGSLVWRCPAAAGGLAGRVWWRHYFDRPGRVGSGPGGMPGEGGGAQVESVGEDGRDLVIQLDERGVALLKRLAGPCWEFRVTALPDGSIMLRPISAPDADLWRSGLVDLIVENFTHPDWMIRMKPDRL